MSEKREDGPTTKLIKSMSEEQPPRKGIGFWNPEPAELVHYQANRGETPLNILVGIVKKNSSLRDPPTRWATNDDGEPMTMAEIAAVWPREPEDGKPPERGVSLKHALNTLAAGVTEGVLCRERESEKRMGRNGGGGVGLRSDVPLARKQRTFEERSSRVHGNLSAFPYIDYDALDEARKQTLIPYAAKLSVWGDDQINAVVAQARERVDQEQYNAIVALGVKCKPRKQREAAAKWSKSVQLELTLAPVPSPVHGTNAAVHEQAAPPADFPVQAESATCTPGTPLLQSRLQTPTTNTVEIKEQSSSQSVGGEQLPVTCSGLASGASVSENPSDEGRTATELPNAAEIPETGEAAPASLRALKAMIEKTGIPKTLRQEVTDQLVAKTAKRMGPVTNSNIHSLRVLIVTRRWRLGTDSLGLICTHLAPQVRKEWWQAEQAKKDEARRQADLANQADAQRNADDAARAKRDKHLRAHPEACELCHGRGKYKWEGKEIVCGCPAGQAIPGATIPPTRQVERTRAPGAPEIDIAPDCPQCRGKGVRWDGHRYVQCDHAKGAGT